MDQLQFALKKKYVKVRYKLELKNWEIQLGVQPYLYCEV